MPLTMNIHLTDKRNWLVVTRHMAAFQKAVQSLDAYYKLFSSKSTSALSPTLRQVFPWPTSFQSLDDKKYEFEYEDQHYYSKLVFFGTITGTKQRICIKFVQRYSKDAHEYCAKDGYAPKLLGFNTIPGDWFTMVMDALTNYISLSQLSSSNRRLASSVFEELYTALKKFSCNQVPRPRLRSW